MKLPFKYQTSETGCIPTSIENCMIHLFHREAIPSDVIQRIHMHSYDYFGRNNKWCAGTSSHAMQLLGTMIESYRTKKFRVKHQYIIGKDVHLGPGNPIDSCLKKGGVVLCVICLGAITHGVVILEVDKKSIFIFDPYLRKRQLKTYNGNVTLLKTDGYSANYRISRKWMDKTDAHGRFCMGPIKAREIQTFLRLK